MRSTETTGSVAARERRGSVAEERLAWVHGDGRPRAVQRPCGSSLRPLPRRRPRRPQGPRLGRGGGDGEDPGQVRLPRAVPARLRELRTQHHRLPSPEHVQDPRQGRRPVSTQRVATILA